MGYEVETIRHALDKKFSESGESPYLSVALKNKIRLSEFFTHLYVLIPVLDDDKHYWVGDDEVEKAVAPWRRMAARASRTEYLSPGNLERLRHRSVSSKRSLVLREFALGVESLERFVRHEPLRRVHESVFGVLALESEPIDPRL